METLVDTFKFWKNIIFGILGIKTQTPVTPTISSAPTSTPLPVKLATTGSPIVVGTSRVFNPSMIVSDREFLDCNSLTEKQIQDFIIFKGSFLKDYLISDHLASYWIYKYCNESGLNPKVLITNIQKEQATITTKTIPTNKRRLNFLCGVGAYDPPRGDDPKWSGIDKQIMGSVQVNVKRYQKALTLKFPYSFISDKPELRKLQIQNAATMSLYNYTPFVGDETLMIGKNKYEKPFGNAFFFAIYNRWFGFSE